MFNERTGQGHELINVMTLNFLPNLKRLIDGRNVHEFVLKGHHVVRKTDRFWAGQSTGRAAGTAIELFPHDYTQVAEAVMIHQALF